MKIQDARAAVGKEWKRLETIPAWNLEKSQEKKGGYSGSTERLKKLMKNVEIDEPTSFLDHVYLGRTQCECKPNETIIEQKTKMSRVSAGATEKLPWQKPHAKTVAWSYDMEGHAQNCAKRCCDLANRQRVQLFKLSSLCLDDHYFKKEELELVG